MNIITLNATCTYTKWEGFGTLIGGWVFAGDNYLDLAFSTKNVPVLYRDNKTTITLPGLGLATLRYGINQLKYADDKRSRHTVQVAMSYGMKHFEVHIKPDISMRSINTCKGDDLSPTSYQKFIDYAVDAVKVMKNVWKFPVTSVGILFNEPTAGWFRKSDCKYPPFEQIHRMLGTALKKTGLKGMSINGVDEYSLGHAMKSYPQIKDVVDSITVHEYSLANDSLIPIRQQFRKLIGPKTIVWQTESEGMSQDDPFGFFFSKLIAIDMNVLRISTWYIRDVISTWNGEFSFAPLNVDYKTGVVRTLYFKYYMYPHYTRFIKPGDMILCSTSPENSVFALNRSTKTLKIVLTITRAQTDFKLNLSPFKSLGSTAEIYYTSVDSKNIFKQLPSIPIKNKELQYHAPTRGYATFIISNAVISKIKCRGESYY